MRTLGPRLTLFVLAGVITFSTSVFAYIVPSHYIVDKISEKRSGLKSLLITSQVRKLQEGQTIGLHFKAVHAVDYVDGVIVSRAYDEDGSEIFVHKRQMQIPGNDVSFPVLLNAVLFQEDPAKLSRVLKLADIPVKSETELRDSSETDDRKKNDSTWLVRWEKDYAWVLSRSKPTSSSDAQLWIWKDRYEPIRLVVDPGKVEGSSPTRVDFGQLSYYKYSFEDETHVFSYPKLISVFDKTELILEEQVEGAIQLNSNLTKFKQVKTLGFTDAGGSVNPPVQQLVRMYYSQLK